MQTKLVEVGGTRVKVRTPYRKTSIMAAEYDRWLRAANPDYAAFKFPEIPQDLLGEDVEDSEINGWKVNFGNKLQQDRIGYALYTEVQRFLPLAARICEATGDIRVNGTGRFEEQDLISAFEHMLNGEDDPTDLWNQIDAAIKELDKPLVPEYQQEGAAESSDPLSAAPTNGGSKASSS